MNSKHILTGTKSPSPAFVREETVRTCSKMFHAYVVFECVISLAFSIVSNSFSITNTGTDISFETVVDMFLKANEDKGLNVYIELMLKSLAPPKPCAQQRTILATWLLQRYLSLSSNPPDRIRNFLDKHVEILDLSTTMSMLASSGEMDLFLFYAERVEAWDRVCAFLNRVGDTKRLLATLTSLSMNLSEQLLYEYVCVRV